MTTKPLLVLHLTGSQTDMGRQHGELVRAHGGHHDTVAYYPNMPTRLLAASGRSRVENAALRASKPLFEWALGKLEQHRSDELRDRSRAFAEGLGIDQRDARYFAVMDVFQNTVAMLAKGGMMGAARRAAAAVPPACSSLAVWGEASADGRLLHARNFDFPGIGIWEQQPVLAFCTPTEGLRYGFATTRGADVPGVTCFNEAGLTLTCHTRFHRDVGFGRAIVDLGHEIIRRATTLDEALTIARETRVASSWGLFISSASEQRAVVIETTASGVEATWPGTDEPFLATTNHYHHPALQVDEISPSPAWLQHCFGRYSVLRGRAAAGKLDVHGLRELLGSHLDPETGGERAAGGVIAQSTTVQSIVSDPERQQLWLSVGECPTGRNGFAVVDWEWTTEPGARLVSAELEEGPVSRYSRGAGGEAWGRYLEACRLAEHGESTVVIRGVVEQAVALDPTEPTWRFLAGAYALRHGEPAAALDHFEVGLTHEQGGFYRGQLLLWGSRAAHEAGRSERARTLRRELLERPEPLLAEHRALAAAEARKPPRTGRWRGVPINLEIPDVG